MPWSQIPRRRNEVVMEGRFVNYHVYLCQVRGVVQSGRMWVRPRGAGIRTPLIRAAIYHRGPISDEDSVRGAH